MRELGNLAEQGWAIVVPLLTPISVLTIGWKARGFIDKLVNNHLAHAKQEVLEAVRDGAKVEDEGHRQIVEAVRDSSDRIIDTMITLQKQ